MTDTDNPKYAFNGMFKSNLTITWNIQGIAGHKEILHIPI